MKKLKNKIFISLLLIAGVLVTRGVSQAEELDYIPYDDWKETYIGRLDPHVEPISGVEFAERWQASKDRDSNGEWYIDEHRVLHMGAKSPDMRPPINDRYDAISFDQRKTVSLKSRHYSGYKFQTIVGLNNVVFQSTSSDYTYEMFSFTKNLISIDLREFSGGSIANKDEMFANSRVQNIIFPDNFPLHLGLQSKFLQREKGDYHIPFYGDISKLRINKNEDMNEMFKGLHFMTPINTSNWAYNTNGDRELVKSKQIYGLFEEVTFQEGSVFDFSVFDPYNLESAYSLLKNSNYSGPIDLANKTYPSLKNASAMFQRVDLKNADFTNLNFPNLTSASEMFYRTKTKDGILDLSTLYMPNVTHIIRIFANTDAKEITVMTKRDNYKKTKEAIGAFGETTQLERTNFFDLALPNLETASEMFMKTNLEVIDTTKFGSSKISYMPHFASDSPNLRELNLSGLRTRSNVRIPAKNWIKNNPNLEEIVFSEFLYIEESNPVRPVITKASQPGYLGYFKSVATDRTVYPNDFTSYSPYINDRRFIAAKAIVDFIPPLSVEFGEIPFGESELSTKYINYTITIDDKQAWTLSAKNSSDEFNLYIQDINVSNQLNVIEKNVLTVTPMERTKTIKIEANENTKPGPVTSVLTWVLTPNIK